MKKDLLLVFDLDGTLINSAIDIHHSLLFILDKYNKPSVTFEQTKRHIGEGLKNLVDSIFYQELELDKNFPETIYDEFRDVYEKICLDNTVAYPGVKKFLSNCPFKIAILSNKPERFVLQTLEGTGLSKYDWVGVFGGDSFSTNKPDPQGLEFLMKKAGTSPDNTIMIGDGVPDVEVALSSGTHLIVTEFGFTDINKLREIGAQNSFSGYENLQIAIDELF